MEEEKPPAGRSSLVKTFAAGLLALSLSLSCRACLAKSPSEGEGDDESCARPDAKDSRISVQVPMRFKVRAIGVLRE
jgi:hypothetical protein